MFNNYYHWDRNWCSRLRSVQRSLASIAVEVDVMVVASYVNVTDLFYLLFDWMRLERFSVYWICNWRTVRLVVIYGLITWMFFCNLQWVSL